MIPKPIRVLILEDDLRLSNLIARFLNNNGMTCFSSHDHVEFYKLRSRHHFDVFLMDINLSSKNGLEICNEVRKTGDSTPIIMISARGIDHHERILGLEMGADDYLSKPFDPKELFLRILKVIKRLDSTSLDLVQKNEIFIFDEFTFDFKKQSLRFNSTLISLNPKETKLIQAFILNHGTPISRTQLSERVYSREHDPHSRDIDMLVSRVRKLLAEFKNKDYIKTIRGVGYQFTA